MTKLRVSILASIAIAFLSTFFLYSSYVRSAVAQEPSVGAVSTENVEEVLEFLVIENNSRKTFSLTELDEDLVLEASAEINSEKIELTQYQSGEETEESIPIPEPQIKFIPKIETITQEIQAESEILKAIEKEIHQESNSVRLKRNEDILLFDEELAVFARERSMNMFEQGYFSHTSPDGCGIVCNFESSGYTTLVWGENIARYEPFNEYTKDIVAEIFIEKWLTSSSHKDNLLSSKFTHEGVGAFVSDGQIIVTVVFAHPK